MEGRIRAVTCKFHALRLVVVDPPPPPLFPNSIRFSVSSGIKSVSVSKKSGAGFGTNESSLKDSIRRFILPREGRREGGKKETREGKCIKKKKNRAKKKRNV